MVWNISEKLYDYEPFENMVLEFKFPGYPSPPLNVLVELMKSIKSWLSADPSNIAVVHCATGFVRTATVVACYLCYCGACDNTREAMSIYYEKRGLDETAVSIPSQIRYLDYTMKLFKGMDPKEKPLKLVCVIANGVPRLGEHSKPYLQIWKNNELQYSSRVKQCRGLTGKTNPNPDPHPHPHPHPHRQDRVWWADGGGNELYDRRLRPLRGHLNTMPLHRLPEEQSWCPEAYQGVALSRQLPHRLHQLPALSAHQAGARRAPQ